MNVQHPKSKLKVPLMELIERFVRHYNRRLAPNVKLQAPGLDASDEAGRLLPTVALGNLVDAKLKSPRLEVMLRRRTAVSSEPAGPTDEPAHEEVIELPTEEEKRQGAVVLRGYDLPQPDSLMFTKEEFDALLAGVDSETLLVLFFEKSSEDTGRCAQLAPAFRQLARRFWPWAVLLRADVDDNKPLALACGVRVAPTFVFFKNHVAVDKLVDGNEMMINVKISKWLKGASKSAAPRYFRGGKSDAAWGSGFLVAPTPSNAL